MNVYQSFNEEDLIEEIDALRATAMRLWNAADRVGQRADALMDVRPHLAVMLETVANAVTEIADDTETEAADRERDLEDAAYPEPDPDAAWDARFDD